MGMDLFMLKTAILPLSAITLAVAATRTRFWSGAVAELAVAFSWFAALASFAVVDSLWRRYGKTGVDASAVLMVIAGALWLWLAVLVIKGPRGARRPLMARLIYGIGLAAVAAHTLRIGRQLYLNTRVTWSEGLAGVSAEAHQRLWIGLACVLILVMGWVLTLRLGTREPHAA
jgi:hypothetical protein